MYRLRLAEPAISMVNTLNSRISDNAKNDLKQEHSSLISDQKLLELYAAMLKCRMLEQRATELFEQGKLQNGFLGSARCKASAVAVTIDLAPGDALCVAPGDCLPALVKGMSPESLLLALVPGAESTGQSLTAAEAERNTVLLADDPSQQHELVLHRAADAREKKNGAVVAVFIPSTPSSPDSWKEVITSAAAETLPVIFVRHTDGEEIRVPSAGRRGGNPQAFFHGVPAIFVDATDPVAIYRVAFEAILRARQNRGATLLECTTVTAWSLDPVGAMENYLRRKAIQPNHHERKIVEAFDRELDLATRFLQH